MVIQVTSSNGEAPASALSPLPGYNGDGTPHTAPHVTAASYERLRAAMSAAKQGDLVPTADGWSCYRDRAAQQHMRDIGLTTIPVGQSIHGEWSIGSAVDFSGLGGFGAARHNWLKANGAPYGWYQPGWAQAGGSLPESWHWEYDQRGDAHINDEPEPEPIEVPEDDRMELVRIAEDGRIMALGTYQWAQVPTMEDYDALSRIWGGYTEVDIGTAQRLNDQVNRNIADLAHSMSVNVPPVQQSHLSWQTVLALVLVFALMVGIVVAYVLDAADGVTAGSGVLVGGILGWVSVTLRTDRGTP